MRASTGKARLRAALADNYRVLPGQGTEGQFDNPKAASILHAIDAIPDGALLKVRHVFEVIRVAERMRAKEWFDFTEVTSPEGQLEPGWKQLTPAAFGIRNKEAILTPATFQKIVDRMNTIWVYSTD